MKKKKSDRRVVVGIPARMASSRFPGKPICKILNFSMIQHVYLRCKLASSPDYVFVATPDDEIINNISNIAGDYIKTKQKASRPGIRVAIACKKLNLKKNDIVIVVQGDEPLIHPDMIDTTAKFLKNSNYQCSNLMKEAKKNEIDDPSEIKVVADINNNALYMSRSPIPSGIHFEKITKYRKQVCVLGFTWGFLEKFSFHFKPQPLELHESIEMLRAIELGYKIKMINSKYETKSVDSNSDRKQVEKIMKEDKLYKNYKYEFKK